MMILILSLLVLLQLRYHGHFIHLQIKSALSRLHTTLLKLAIQLRLHQPHRRYWHVTAAVNEETIKIYRSRAKPEWVKHEVLHLKALMPHTGCRTLADIFNRRFADSRKMTVGKTYVADTLRKYHYEVALLRRKIQNAKPKAVPKNLIWAMDLTGKATLDGKTSMILAILEHGSRAVLALEAVRSKSSWVMVSNLVTAIRRYGKPGIIRTDNEAIFTSRVFGLALFLLGIRQQTTDLHCPWQNGRVERFFGTLKDKLNQLAVSSFDALNIALGEYRFFYNHVRPHQNMGGATPAEAWAGVNPYRTKFKQEYWFEAWDGLLQGYYLRR